MDLRLDYRIAESSLAARRRQGPAGRGCYPETAAFGVGRCEAKIGSLVEGPEAEQTAGNGAQRGQIRRTKSDKVAFRRIIYFFADIGGSTVIGHDPKHAVSSLRNGARSAAVQVADFLRVITGLRLFSPPFPSHKRLVSRRLWNNRGLIELRQKEKNVSQDKSTTDEQQAEPAPNDEWERNKPHNQRDEVKTRGCQLQMNANERERRNQER
jgi:hypothetical protein